MEATALNGQPLIIVGASARAAAFSALRAGFSPYAIDLFADSDLAAVCPAVKINRYPADFAAALAAAPLAPWMYVGGLENHPRLVDRLAKLRPLWGNRSEVLRLVRNPLRLAEGLAADGINCPAVRLSPPEPSTAVRWLRKPVRSGAGL